MDKFLITWAVWSCFSLNMALPTCFTLQQVCELDIIFNFEKAYFILDEFLLGGEAQETSKKNVLKAIEQADLLQEVWFGGGVGEPQGGVGILILICQPSSSQ